MSKKRERRSIVYAYGNPREGTITLTIFFTSKEYIVIKLKLEDAIGLRNQLNSAINQLKRDMELMVYEVR